MTTGTILDDPYWYVRTMPGAFSDHYPHGPNNIRAREPGLTQADVVARIADTGRVIGVDVAWLGDVVAVAEATAREYNRRGGEYGYTPETRRPMARGSGACSLARALWWASTSENPDVAPFYAEHWRLKAEGRFRAAIDVGGT